MSGKTLISLISLVALTYIWPQATQAQAQEQRQPVQISGIVVTADSAAQYIPYVNVISVAGRGGTVSSPEGFFSFATLPNDTLVFSSIGFKKERLVVPDTLRDNKYLARVVMQRDTTMLEEVTLYPWPSRDQFKEAFLATRPEMTKNDIARRNLAIQELKARAEDMGYSSAEIQDYAIQMQNQQIYNYGRYQGFDNAGTAILGRLSDPFAWASFFNSLQK